ncbi:MAG: hypothetical protein GX620_06135 [Chloroflexi bacterium]|nr:hypothetical protein [Chloroflexota bacterium]
MFKKGFRPSPYIVASLVAAVIAALAFTGVILKNNGSSRIAVGVLFAAFAVVWLARHLQTRRLWDTIGAARRAAEEHDERDREETP